jgi:hypothetical protein
MNNCDCACEAPRDVPCDACEEQCIKPCEKQPSITARQMGHEKAREVRIEQQDLGYIVRVGCQTFCLENLDTVLTMVSEYLCNPNDLEKQWREGTLKIKQNVKTNR